MLPDPVPPPAAAPERTLCTDCGISRSADPRRCGRACQFIEPDYELPNIMISSFTLEKFSASHKAHKWLLDLLDERHRRWDEFNGYLVSEGWIGLT